MLNILTFNKWEVLLFAVAVFLLILHYQKAQYSWKETLIYTLILMPVLYFSINMVTEAVTADEPQYEECITDIRHLKEHSAAGKVLYEYKFAQLTIGTVFLLIPQEIKNYLGANNLWMLYKCIHWMLMYIFSLMTAVIWRKYIFNGKEIRTRIAENAVLISLIGFPLTCLLMKVTNYDAGSTYPAILGISMIWAAFNKNDMKLGFAATVITALGVLDKWTALPYWIISVMLFAFLTAKNSLSWKKRLYNVCFSVITAYFTALLLNLFYFLYAGIQQNGFIKKVDWGILVFSFVHALRAVMTGDLSVNSSFQDIFYIPVLICVMIVGVLIIYFIYRCLEYKEIGTANAFLKIDGMLLLLQGGGGIISTYFIPLCIAPVMEIKNGNYISTDSFDGWIYHYGAKTAIAHFVDKVCYEWATIVVDLPTAILVLLVFVSLFLIKENHSQKLLPCSFILSGSIMLLILYAIQGLPSDARYYSYPMIVIVLATIYLGYTYFSGRMLKNKILCAGYILYVIEMCIFIPNVKVFSPMWLWHSSNHNEEVRKGQWYAGEAMFWGEQVAIAGNLIKEIEGTKNCENIILYSDYTYSWPGNPGYNLVSLLDQEEEKLRFDEKAYYIINRFRIFRNDIPAYIYEIEPIASVKYKGETGAYIYRGDQLKDYSTDILNEYFGRSNQ